MTDSTALNGWAPVRELPALSGGAITLYKAREIVRMRDYNGMGHAVRLIGKRAFVHAPTVMARLFGTPEVKP